MAGHPGQALTFPSRGLKLRAHVYRPPDDGPGAPRPRPAVVVHHGSGLEQDSKPGVVRLLAESDDMLAALRFERHLFAPFGATAMEAHQIWTHAPFLWAPVVLPFLARWVADEGHP